MQSEFLFKVLTHVEQIVDDVHEEQGYTHDRQSIAPLSKYPVLQAQEVDISLVSLPQLPQPEEDP